jgi:antirestriction protein ArdC
MKLEIPKELRGKELGKYLSGKLDEIADSICQCPDEIEKFVKRWNGGFHTYSINNTILIWLQKPETIENPLICGYKAWQGKGRQVNKGERSIRILAPMTKKIEEDNGDITYIVTGYFPVSVFHISQTSKIDGQPDLTEDLGCPDLISGYMDFERIAKACPVPVNIKDLGLSNGNTNGNTINITPKKNKAAMCATLIHEWAHVALGHCEDTGILFETEDRSAKEVAAETVSFIVCSAIGIQNNKSRLYIGSWDGNKEELKNSGKHFISVAESIIRKLADE